ncbi:MAG: hypothetical protein OEZ48_07790 [Candidatus Bathyarchaeota archaeon]|nr:hypothetical protein [Candidatus Bathyarchaeota archaeon]
MEVVHKGERRTKAIYSIKCIAVLLIALAIGFGLGYWVLPKEPNVLTEEQVRQIVRERPGSMHLEVRPETVKFLDLFLSLREGKMVWIVEYKCEGRSIGFYLPEGYDPPPFVRMLAQVVIDAYTGDIISMQTSPMEIYVEPMVLVGSKPVELPLEGDEVRTLIVEDPYVPDLEVRSETVWLLNITFDYAEKVWVVEYHIEGRQAAMGEAPFMPMYFRAVIDRDTGEKISVEKIELEIPENILAEDEVRRIIMEDAAYRNIEVKPETIEFQSLKLVCLRKATQTYVWIVDYEIDGRGTGIVGVRINTTTGEEEIMESPFRRMHFQRQIDARTGREIWTRMSTLELDDC